MGFEPGDPRYLLPALVDFEADMAEHANEAMRRLTELLERKTAVGAWWVDELDEARERVEVLNQFAPGRIWLSLPRRES